jgi:hypothetical protein
MRTPTRAIGGKVNHETGHAPMGFGAHGPVVVVRVVATSIVALGPEFFDEDEGFPALEAAGAVFDALGGMVARESRFVRVTDFSIQVFLTGGEDCRGLEAWGAACVCVLKGGLHVIGQTFTVR